MLINTVRQMTIFNNFIRRYIEMLKRIIFLCVAFPFILVSVVSFAGEQTSGRDISEKLIVQFDLSSLVKESFTISPDSRHVAYVTKSDNKVFVFVDGKKEKQYDGIMEKQCGDSLTAETLIFSP